MTSKIAVGTALLLALTACTPVYEGQNGGAVGAIPEEVAQIAAPYQDLTSARLRPEDGCYWYLHAGPVETTLIPLRDTQGRIICSTNSSGLIG